MQKGYSIQLDEQNDLKIAVKRDLNGKIVQGQVIGATDGQNQLILMKAHPGEIKHAPVTGVGIDDMLLDNDPLYWRSRIRQAFEKEGFKIKQFDLSNEIIDIDASY